MQLSHNAECLFILRVCLFVCLFTAIYKLLSEIPLKLLINSFRDILCAPGIAAGKREDDFLIGLLVQFPSARTASYFCWIGELEKYFSWYPSMCGRNISVEKLSSERRNNVDRLDELEWF